ncbi:hypothetical protein N7527_008745 [Penicillium freii]|nr:hypothetical protein N7527_008745 [Penicillium freii]
MRETETTGCLSAAAVGDVIGIVLGIEFVLGVKFVLGVDRRRSRAGSSMFQPARDAVSCSPRGLIVPK